MTLKELTTGGIGMLLDWSKRTFEGTGIGAVPGVFKLYSYFLAVLDHPVELYNVRFYPCIKPGRDVYLVGETENEILDVWIDAARDAAVVVDVGAAVGLYSILAAKYSGANVFAFDPDKARLRTLQRNLLENGIENVQPRLLALGDRDGQILDPGSQSREIVPLKRMDDLDLKPDLLKIDVEGWEFNVLRGAETTIETFQPVIFLEVHANYLAELGEDADELRSWLEQRGYRITTLLDRGSVENWRCDPQRQN